MPRLSFSSSSSSGSDSCKRISLAKPAASRLSSQVKPISYRGTSTSSEPTSLKINPSHKHQPSSSLQPLKATISCGFASAAANAAAASESKSSTTCASAPVQRKFPPPIAASSPKSGKAVSIGFGTPPRSRKSIAVKSSGYGQQPSSLNTSRVSLDSSISRVSF